MTPKHKRGGMLSHMVKYPKSSSSKKTKAREKVMMWAGGILVAAFVLLFLVVILNRILNPTAGTRVSEGDFVVERILENPPGYLPEEHVVAAAFVLIENRKVPVPMTTENRRGVEKGKSLHVKYRFVPLLGQVTVQEWRLK